MTVAWKRRNVENTYLCFDSIKWVFVERDCLEFLRDPGVENNKISKPSLVKGTNIAHLFFIFHHNPTLCLLYPFSRIKVFNAFHNIVPSLLPHLDNTFRLHFEYRALRTIVFIIIIIIINTARLRKFYLCVIFLRPQAVIAGSH